MSEYKKVVGTLTPIKPFLPLEQACEEVAKENSWEKSYHDNWQQVILDEGYNKYYISGDDLYSINADFYRDSYDVFVSSSYPDGTIGFTVLYYDGGMGLDEALDKAVNGV